MGGSVDKIKKCRLASLETYTYPGPATLLSKGYASLFQKTLRKGQFLCFLYFLDFGKKGPFFKECHQFRKKRVFFRAFSLEKGYFLVVQVSVYFNKRGPFFHRKYQ